MECISYKKGYKYQLTDTYRLKISIRPLEHILTDFIDLSPSGWLIIRKGYAWDGCSGPTYDDKTNMRAGLVHDALYQLLREELLPQSVRKQADDEFKKICFEDGMNQIRAWYYYCAVRKFAESAALPQNKRMVLKAPKGCK